MSDWKFLNGWRVRRGMLARTNEDGFNGAFAFPLPGVANRVICVCSDGLGWQHVSVSLHGSPKTPSWEIMSKVKDLFWEEDQCVVQFHPPKGQYVNNHPGCLHLWRCVDGREQPIPDALLVGVKEVGVVNSPEQAEQLYRQALEKAKELECTSEK